jgi:hypothetical protein
MRDCRRFAVRLILRSLCCVGAGHPPDDPRDQLDCAGLSGTSLQERPHTLEISIWVPVPNTQSEFQAKRLGPRRVASSAWAPRTRSREQLTRPELE